MAVTYDARLAELRRFDSVGHYAHDGLVTGRDETGTLLVTVDPTRRVVGVSSGRLDDSLRRPAGLAHAVRRAHTDAVMDAVELGLRAAGRIDPTAPRRNHAAPAGSAPSVAELHPDFGHAPVDMELFRSLPDRPGPRTTGPHVGHSDNDCVTVTLDAAGPCGEVETDPGWLANAGPAAVAAAVHQAFTAAYQERDHHG
ncbi:hypothetical protein [Nocardioides halotolerans]|uniref:hypothetical protein n=1 Tax=Nocardioides halotolerans TaxID=433660 RepID=UPI0012F874CD|nr:hypothetical protein [Nocardioides halotolerans]